MQNLVFVFVGLSVLMVVTMARPEPELLASRYPAAYTNGLANHHLDNSQQQQGTQQGYISQGYSSGYSSGGSSGPQVPYDEGEFRPSSYAGQTYSVSSQNLESSHAQLQQQQQHQSQSHQHQHHQQQQQQQQEQEQQQYVEQQNNGFVGHHTYGNQQENSHQQLDVDVASNAGEGIIDPRINDEAPEVSQREFIPSARAQNNYDTTAAQQSSYITPTAPQQTYVPSSSAAAHSSYQSSAVALAHQNTYHEQQLSHNEHHQNTYSQSQSSYQPSGNAYSSSASGGYYPSAARPIIHKHVYVHVPPKDFEDEIVPVREHFPVRQAQKHYKIIFIKAPSPPQYRAPILPIIPQNEEKTLIYVLHKKPEQPEEIIIPTVAPTQPSKPEVYFIKYKTRKETVSGLYGAPVIPTTGSESSAGYADSNGYSGSSAGLIQTTTGQEIEHETNIPTESDHHYQANNNNNDELLSSTLHSNSIGPVAVSAQSSSYGPPHKTD